MIVLQKRKENLMKKEIYQIKCPKHIVFGDPMYFEEFKGAELKRLTVDYRPPKYLDTARLVLKERAIEEVPEYADRTMTLYLAPSQSMEVYQQGKMYASQKIEQKVIGVDTARYYLSIDSRADEIKTGADGCWGCFEEYYRENGKDRIIDAVALTVTMPENQDFDGMKQLAGYFFGELESVMPKRSRKKDAPAR